MRYNNNKTFLDIYEGLRKHSKKEEDEKENTKEILKELHKILLNQYTEKPESRTLIFVSTRVCAQRLSEHLSSYLSNIEDLEMFYKKTNIVGYMTSLFLFEIR